MKTYLLPLLLVSVANCYADNATKSLQTTVKLNPTCEIKVANFNLGEITPGQPSATALTDFTVKCNQKTIYYYYIGFRQYGWDCSFLEGNTKKDRMLFGITDMKTGTHIFNNMTGNGSAGRLGSGTGNGQTQSYTMKATIQPLDSGKGCPTPIKAPGLGYNPYVTPDTYSDTLTFGIIY